MTTKAFKSTSQEALHILLDILPIELHLEKVSTYFALKLQKQGHWPHHSISIEPSARKTFETCQQIMDNTINNMFKGLKLNILQNDYIKPSNIINKDYNIQIGHRLEFDLPELTDNITFVYTDGSKQADDRTGYGVYIYHHESVTTIEEFDRLQPFNTVFQSEAYAIIRATSILIDAQTKQKNIHIFSDSQSVLNSLTGIDTNRQTILTFHEMIQSLTKHNNVNLRWIPAHSGHMGNEKADELTNKGARKDDEPCNNCPPILLSYLKSCINECVKNRQLLHWRYIDVSEKCKEMINPVLEAKVNRNKKVSTLNLNMMKDITQFITGHNH